MPQDMKVLEQGTPNNDEMYNFYHKVYRNYISYAQACVSQPNNKILLKRVETITDFDNINLPIQYHL